MLNLQRIRAEKCRRSLAEFMRQAWHVFEPSTELKWSWVLDAICDHAQALLEDRLIRDGKVIRNLVVNVPPGTSKSTSISVCLPAWQWTRTPSWRGLFASGNDDVATRDSIKCRVLLDSEWYRSMFRPTWHFARDQNMKTHYQNSATGFRQSIPAGAIVVGQRAEDLFVDDPNGTNEGEAARERVVNWWDNAMWSRLNDLDKGHRMIIQQRVHEDDLTGHILAKDPENWAFLVIRMEYEKPGPKDPDYLPTPGLQWVDPRTLEGELMFPERFPAHTVEEQKTVLGSVGTAGQLQQRPAPKGGVIFKKGFVQTFNPDYLPKFSRTVLTLDTAFKTKEENDYSVCLEIGEAEMGYYILGRWKEKASYPDLKFKVKTMADARRPTAVLIEDKASGQSLVQDLERESRLPVVAIKVDTDKVARAHAVVATWEAKRIFVPEGAGWVDDFLDQLYGFPKLAHDDDVDSFTQGINYLRAAPGPIVISSDFLKRLR